MVSSDPARGLSISTPGLFFVTYLGYWLMGLAMLSIGMVASFLTPNLTVSFILGMLFNAILVMTNYADVLIPANEQYAERVEDKNKAIATYCWLGEDVALVDPDLDADAAEGGVRFGEAVVDVGAERVARDTARRLRLAAGHLGATEAAGDGDAHAEGAALHGALDGLLDRAAEGDATLELVGDGAGDQVGIELRRADLLDVHADAAAGEALQRVAQLFDLLRRRGR